MKHMPAGYETPQACSETVHQSRRPSLVESLPTELRLEIYKWLFQTDGHIEITGWRSIGDLDDQSYSIPSITGTRLLETCKTIHEEAAEVLYGKHYNSYYRSHRPSGRGNALELESWLSSIGKNAKYLKHLNITVNTGTPLRWIFISSTLFSLLWSMYSPRFAIKFVPYTSNSSDATQGLSNANKLLDGLLSRKHSEIRFFMLLKNFEVSADIATTTEVMRIWAKSSDSDYHYAHYAMNASGNLHRFGEDTRNRANLEHLLSWSIRDLILRYIFGTQERFDVDSSAPPVLEPIPGLYYVNRNIQRICEIYREQRSYSLILTTNHIKSTFGQFKLFDSRDSPLENRASYHISDPVIVLNFQISGPEQLGEIRFDVSEFVRGMIDWSFCRNLSITSVDHNYSRVIYCIDTWDLQQRLALFYVDILDHFGLEKLATVTHIWADVHGRPREAEFEQGKVMVNDKKDWAKEKVENSFEDSPLEDRILSILPDYSGGHISVLRDLLTLLCWRREDWEFHSDTSD